MSRPVALVTGARGGIGAAIVRRLQADGWIVHGVDAVIERHAVKRLLEPSEVADVVAFLLDPAGRGFSGVPVPLDLGWTAA